MGSVYRTVPDKLKLLALAKKYKSVTKACKELNFSRDSYYRIRDLYKRLGEAGMKPMSRRRPLLKNQVKPQVKEVVLLITREHPDWTARGVASAAYYGDPRLPRRTRPPVRISSSGVRGVWLRHDPALTTRRQRLSVYPKPKPPEEVPTARYFTCRRCFAVTYAATSRPFTCRRCGTVGNAE